MFFLGSPDTSPREHLSCWDPRYHHRLQWIDLWWSPGEIWRVGFSWWAKNLSTSTGLAILLGCLKIYTPYDPGGEDCILGFDPCHTNLDGSEIQLCNHLRLVVHPITPWKIDGWFTYSHHPFRKKNDLPSLRESCSMLIFRVYLQSFLHSRWLALGFLNHPQYHRNIMVVNHPGIPGVPLNSRWL